MENGRRVRVCPFISFASLNMADEELLVAAELEDLALVKRLVRNGANLSYSDGIGETALHESAERGKLDVVKHLIEKEGVKVNVRTKVNFGKTYTSSQYMC